MYVFFLVVFAFFGLIIGSFLNVVIFRFNSTKSLGGRSQCLTCRTTLHWYDLIPVFSYIFLKGRCRGCKTRISIQYPAVELLTALLFAALYSKFSLFFFISLPQFSVLFAYYAAIFALLVVVTVYDIRHKIIPDRLSLIFGILAFFGLFFIKGSFVMLHWPVAADFLSGLVVSVPFALLWFVSGGRWMGLGDAKLAVGLGFLLGMSNMLFATMIAFWSGAIVGLALVGFRKLAGLKSEIPFAPFLVFGTVVAFFFGSSINLFF